MKKISTITSIALICFCAFSMVASVQGMNDVLDAKSYWESQGDAEQAINTLEDGLETLKSKESAYQKGLKEYKKGKADYATGLAEYEKGQNDLAAGKKRLSDGEAEYSNGLRTIRTAERNYGGSGVPVLKAAHDNVDRLLAARGNLNASASIVASSSGGRVNAAQAQAIFSGVNELVRGYSEQKAIATVAATAGSDAKTVGMIYKGVKQAMSQGLPQTKAIEAVSMQSGVPASVITAAYGGVVKLMSGYSHSEAYATVAAKSGTDAASVQTVYSNVAALYNGLSKSSAESMVASAAGKSAREINKAYAGYNTYVNGKQKLASAKVQLANGRTELAEGQAKLDAGQKELAKGKAKLAAAEKQLKQFEDGRAQAIEGTETLLATESYEGVDSITDRLGADFNYMKNKTDIDYNEAAKAITAAREFLVDTRAAVTDELTARGIGYAVLIASALLGALAAFGLLTARKKFALIAGVLSIASAIFGLVKESGAGHVMSDVAGSSIGSIQYIAPVLMIIAALAAILLKRKESLY